MTIKNKDGTVFKLNGPNPIMSKQESWDRAKIRLINFSHKKEIILDARNHKKASKELSIDIGKELGLKEFEQTIPSQETFKKPNAIIIPTHEFIREITRIEESKEVAQEPRPIQEIPVKEDLTPVQEEIPVKEDLTPVQEEIPVKEEPIEINVDQKVARIIKERGVEYHCVPATDSGYGQPFIFDGILIDQSDFEIQIWSIRNIPKKSVFYKISKNGGERWWRVRDVEPKSGGFLTISMISDVNPDFS